jgi:hypothetical protein
MCIIRYMQGNVRKELKMSMGERVAPWVGAAFGIVLLAGLVVVLARSMPAKNERTPEPARPDVVVLKTEAMPADSGASHPAAVRHVYECIVDGQRIFSDQRCGPDAAVRAIQESNTFEPPQIPDEAADVPATSTQRRVSPDSNARLPENCDAYENEVERWDARMRQSYASSEGEYLRARRAEANEAFYACIRRRRSGG